MANFFCATTGDNTTGTSWATAKTTLASAMALATTTGDIVYVDSAYNRTATAAITLDAPTASTSIAVICVTPSGTSGHSGWATTAQEKVGAANAGMSICTSRSQNVFFHGIQFSSGSNTSSSTVFNIATGTTHGNVITFSNCAINMPTAATNSGVVFGNGHASGNYGTTINFINCSFGLPNFSGAGSCLGFNFGKFNIVGCTVSYTGASKPSSLFAFASGATPEINVRVRDSDLSAFNTTSGSLIPLTDFRECDFLFQNCKIAASPNPSITSGSWPAGNRSKITLVNTDSNDTNNVFRYYDRLGTLVEESGIYRNGGATLSDAAVSWKIVTQSTATETEPFYTPWIHRWVNATGSTTFSVELLRDSVTDYTDRQVWMEVEVLENASAPNGTMTSTRNSQPFDGTAVDLTNSTNGSWTETLTNDNEMIISATRTVAEKSFVRARIGVALASTTFYVDPVLQISGQPNNCPTRWTVEGAVNAEPVVPKANYIAGL